jgi:hypothetical protein
MESFLQFGQLAYIDPAAGGFLLQLIFGGLAGLAVIVKLQWHRVKGLFCKQGAGGHDEAPSKRKPEA